MTKKSSMFSRGGRQSTTTVDVHFMIEEMTSNGTLSRRDQRIRQIDTTSTSYARLKDMARFHFKIQGDVELWLLEGGCPSPINIRLDDPISKAITKDSTIQVEKLGDYGLDGAFLWSQAICTVDNNDRPIPVATVVASSTTQDVPRSATTSRERELDDEEFAIYLSMELNGIKFNQDECTAKHAFSSSKRPPRPLGKVVAQAQFSQFSFEGGRSACTSICLYAAAQLLHTFNKNLSCISPNTLDGFLEHGTRIYDNVYLHQGDHTSVDDLWDIPTYSDIVRMLVRGPPISGTTSQNSFLEALMTALSYAASRNEISVALVVTKPPETVLIICNDVSRSAPWFLFDSHGLDYADPKRAYVMHLGTVETAAAALHLKFPDVKGLGDSLHAQQMNMFEAHPICRKQVEDEYPLQLKAPLAQLATSQVPAYVECDSDATEPLLEKICSEYDQTNGLRQEKTPLQDDDANQVTLAPLLSPPSGAPVPNYIHPDVQNKPQPPIPQGPLQPDSDEVSPCKPAVVAGNLTRPITEQQQARALQDTDLVRDPITGMLFADPVFCDKGHTHERSSIESHFRARREMKAEEEARARQGQGGTSSQEDNCGSGRNFEPTCPLTGEAISEILINNDQCDRMLPILVEAGLIIMEDGELEDWKERRQEKRRLAEEKRAQDAARLDAPQVTHQQSAAIIQEESRPSTEQNITANTVRIQRSLRACSPAGHFDLGIAVAICPSDWERPVLTSVQIPRCNNSCCRSRLRKSNRGTCARCTQALCTHCLLFHVEEINRGGAPTSEDVKVQHRICPECVLQISNVLRARSDPESDSKESQMVKELDKTMRHFFLSMKDRKAQLQHQVAHYNKHQNFVTEAERLNQQVAELQQTRDSLENQIRQAREQAEAARQDQTESSSGTTPTASDSATSEEIRLQTRIAELQAEYDNLDWTTEEGMIRGSLVEHQLNETILQLALAQSSISPTASSDAESDALTKSKEQITVLESRCAAVLAKHDALLAKGPSNEHDHEHAMKVSQLLDEYERLSMELVQAYEDRENRRAKSAVKAARKSSTIETDSASCPKQKERGGVRLRRIACSIAEFVVSPFASVKVETSNDVVSSIISPPSFNAASTAIAISDLAAIGVIGIEEVFQLPLGLQYPSTQIRNQVLVLRNDLELARLESERVLDEEYDSCRSQLQARVESLEDEVVKMRREVLSAQATAEEEQRLRQERMARREAAERERKRLEQERADEAARLRREQERLEAARRQEEAATRQSLQGLDLRKCGNPTCGYGPFEKFNCNDMAAHNDVFYVIDANGRRQKRRRNECPKCQWTNSDWKAWPPFEV